jgi:hypothetical protein
LAFIRFRGGELDLDLEREELFFCLLGLGLLDREGDFFLLIYPSFLLLFGLLTGLIERDKDF